MLENKMDYNLFINLLSPICKCSYIYIYLIIISIDSVVLNMSYRISSIHAAKCIYDMLRVQF